MMMAVSQKNRELARWMSAILTLVGNGTAGRAQAVEVIQGLGEEDRARVLSSLLGILAARTVSLSGKRERVMALENLVEALSQQEKALRVMLDESIVEARTLRARLRTAEMSPPQPGQRAHFWDPEEE